MSTSKLNPIGLRIIELPPQLIKKSAYSAVELELLQTAVNQLESTRGTCVQMLEDAQQEIEMICRQTVVKTQADCLEELSFNLEKLTVQQQMYEQRIIEHCAAIIEIAWKKLTVSLPLKSQIESLLNQVKSSLIEGVYYAIECNTADLQYVEDYIRNLKTSHLHLDHIAIETSNSLESGRVRLKAKRGGGTMIDYSFAVESIAHILQQKSDNPETLFDQPQF
ncbi:hypothetical protein [Limnobacter alexandrii]|uniref:hypothetical protein n=1 Tax=Limnobacter alexandrii TaxID=2570352 RepID=UPI001107DF3D|nr:hypothetical protein [Limnobacter alexandrii]